uniref:Uncharacterized protein n=1 Tax=Oryza brachyantha TaxID=4533 RepID=J3KZ12_ORYBR
MTAGGNRGERQGTTQKGTQSPSCLSGPPEIMDLGRRLGVLMCIFWVTKRNKSWGSQGHDLGAGAAPTQTTVKTDAKPFPAEEAQWLYMWPMGKTEWYYRFGG